MKEVNWNEVKIRCSSLGCLFTEPVSKADKEAGVLSKTAKTHLIEVYAKELWGVEKDIVTQKMRKGTDAEEDGITLLSRVDKAFYVKNDERKENEWISGHADIVEEDIITDLKLSWDAFTFLPKMMDEPEKNYLYQLHGYMMLWDKQGARISYALVDTPQNIIDGEKYRLLKNMDVISEESPEYIRAAEKLEASMKFSHIKPEHRVIHQIIDRNEEIIQKIPQKVQKAREYLSEIYQTHMNINQLK
jgi:hypothetical protein